MLRHVASWGDRYPHIVHVAQCGEALSSRPVAIGALDPPLRPLPGSVRRTLWVGYAGGADWGRLAYTKG
jgi:hypothetical protein